MAKTMKPGPFEKLREEAREYGIDVDDLKPDDQTGIADVNLKISEAKAERDLKELANENEQPVMVRIVEWADWIPATDFAEMGESLDRRTGERVAQKMPMHNGFSGFMADKSERLLEVAVQGTGHKRIVTLADGEPDEHGKKPQIVFGRYAFQAVLARNVSEEFLRGVRDGQLKPLIEEEEREAKEGRDRRSDLIVVQNQVQDATTPNREQRRNAAKKGGRR